LEDLNVWNLSVTEDEMGYLEYGESGMNMCVGDEIWKR
jgi:hypothetical protein